jgi:uncharacterized protein (TIGR03437 family)
MKNLKAVLILCLLAAAPGMRAQVPFNNVPSRIIGQPILQQQGILTAIAPNLVEGRELNTPHAVAVDTSATPNILYVADTNNNRVLAWRNATGFTKGDKADFVIGQRAGDFLSTTRKGPGTSLSSGLAEPIALAVDSNGNLYVSDAGNNRVVRYPKPLSQNSELLAIDLIIGQRDSNGAAANEGGSTPTEKTLFLGSGNSFFRAGLALDKNGALWVSDPGNNRVLRFPAGQLAANTTEPAADLALGQPDLRTGVLPASPARNGKNFLAQPSGLAFDPLGRLFVPDDFNRVMVYVPPFSTGMLAARILGVVLPTQAQPTPPTLNATTLGSIAANGQPAPPEGVFFVGSNPFVVDTGNARILEFDPLERWPPEAQTFSPAAIAVIGQPDFTSNLSNAGQVQPSESTLSGPRGAHNNVEANGVINGVFVGTDIYVADAGNNRVLVFPQSTNFKSANRLLGQLDFKFNSVNLIEGREFFFLSGGGVAIDTKSDPPHLYVADPPNNRILGFADFRKVNPGDRADLVIGQADFFSALINFPKNDTAQLNDQGLNFPVGVAVDSNGDLWVADNNNGRVLRFPKPFAQGQTSAERANLVIGQPNFFTHITDASSQTMRSPFGIAFSQDGHLLVSDTIFNRVLFFLKPRGGDFVNGQSASEVFGQPDFGPPSQTLAANILASPRNIAVDGSDRLFVTDPGNNRVVVYRNVPTAGNDPSPTLSITDDGNGGGLNAPQGVIVNQATNEIWVADSFNNRVLRYPTPDLVTSNNKANVIFQSQLPLAIALDPFGNPVVVEATANRVAFFYPAIDLGPNAGGVAGRFSGSAANYFERFAPGMLASIFSFTTTQFGTQTASLSSVPAPTTLGDIEVFVDGIRAPLLFVNPAQINFQIPNGVVVGSTAEIQVVRSGTGQIIASTLIRIDPASPALFTSNASGTGQLAAVNQDGTINDGSHPAKAGSIISLYGTGTGLVSGSPPDGQPATGIINTDEKPQVFINAVSGPVPPEDVLFSGFAPGFVGLWQINVRVPKNVPPGDVDVVVVYRGFQSNRDQFGNLKRVTIRVTP